MDQPQLLAQLTDADTTFSIYSNADTFQLEAVRDDGVSPAYVVYQDEAPNLAHAIKALMVFFVGEWEPTQHANHLRDRLVEVIQAH